MPLRVQTFARARKRDWRNLLSLWTFGRVVATFASRRCTKPLDLPVPLMPGFKPFTEFAVLTAMAHHYTRLQQVYLFPSGRSVTIQVSLAGVTTNSADIIVANPRLTSLSSLYVFFNPWASWPVYINAFLIFNIFTAACFHRELEISALKENSPALHFDDAFHRQHGRIPISIQILSRIGGESEAAALLRIADFWNPCIGVPYVNDFSFLPSILFDQRARFFSEPSSAAINSKSVWVWKQCPQITFRRPLPGCWQVRW